MRFALPLVLAAAGCAEGVKPESERLPRGNALVASAKNDAASPKGSLLQRLGGENALKNAVRSLPKRLADSPATKTLANKVEANTTVLGNFVLDMSSGPSSHVRP